MGKRKERREERRFLINHAIHVAKVINQLEPLQCEAECTDHHQWACEAVAQHTDGSPDHHMVMAGAVYPDGGWTAHIIERDDPTYQERMAFVPPHYTLVWEFGDDRETIVLDLDEVASLLVGSVPNN